MYLKNVILLLSLLILSLILFPLSAAGEEDHKVYEVIVVGGGIAGLTAAYHLQESDLLLLEKEEQAGGRVRSGEKNGISYARGAAYIGTPESPLKEIISTLNLNLREIPPPADVYFYGGKMYFGDYGKAQLLINKSSLQEFNRFALKILSLYQDYDEIPEIDLRGELKRMDTITARQWFDESNFSQIYSDIYNVTFRGLFGANINEISALSALPELAFDFEGFEEIEEEEDVAEEFADGNNSTGMYSFDGGIAEIPVAIAQHLGERVQPGTTVTAITKVDELFEIVCILADNTTAVYRSEAVIIATPAGITLDIAQTVLSKEQKQLLASVHYAPCATVALFSDTPIFNKGFDLAVPDGFFFTDIYDATWVANHFNKPKGKPGFVNVVYAAPLSYRDPVFMTIPDQEFVGKIVSQLDQIIPGSSALVETWEITRFPFGYPVMTPGSYARMNRLTEISGDGLFLAGDYLVYPTFEAAAASGHLAAEEALEWLDD